MRGILRCFAPQSGFTIIEVVLVAAIITILALAIIPTFLNSRKATTNSQAKSNLKQALSLAQNYYNQNNSYDPNSTSTLCEYLQTSNSRIDWRGVGCVITTADYSSPNQIKLVTVNDQQLVMCAKSGTGQYYCVQDNNDFSA